jgi:hypothetical protein
MQNNGYYQALPEFTFHQSTRRMKKVNEENERIKRCYLRYLRGARRKNSCAIEKAAGGILRFEASTSFGNFKTKTARFWAYDRDERPWGSDVPPAAWYQFTPDRKGIRHSQHLKDYQGWMHADGYAGFEELYCSGKIKEVACMAHVRRKFVDVFKSQGSHVAEQAIQRIAQLYAVEKEARGLPPERRVELRLAKAKPILDDLES